MSWVPTTSAIRRFLERRTSRTNNWVISDRYGGCCHPAREQGTRAGQPRCLAHAKQEGHRMTLTTILIIILILIVIGVVPAWPHSRSWGYGPSGIVGLILVVLLILVLMGRI
jgi:hypothetical protein